MEMAWKIPNGNDLLKTLICLLADQEGCKIKYELEGDEDDESKKRQHCMVCAEDMEACCGAGIGWPDYRRHVGSTAGICS